MKDDAQRESRAKKAKVAHRGLRINHFPHENSREENDYVWLAIIPLTFFNKDKKVKK